MRGHVSCRFGVTSVELEGGTIFAGNMRTGFQVRVHAFARAVWANRDGTMAGVLDNPFQVTLPDQTRTTENNVWSVLVAVSVT